MRDATICDRRAIETQELEMHQSLQLTQTFVGDFLVVPEGEFLQTF